MVFGLFLSLCSTSVSIHAIIYVSDSFLLRTFTCAEHRNFSTHQLQLLNCGTSWVNLNIFIDHYKSHTHNAGPGLCVRKGNVTIQTACRNSSVSDTIQLFVYLKINCTKFGHLAKIKVPVSFTTYTIIISCEIWGIMTMARISHKN